MCRIMCIPYKFYKISTTVILIYVCVSVFVSVPIKKTVFLDTIRFFFTCLNATKFRQFIHHLQ